MTTDNDARINMYNICVHLHIKFNISEFNACNENEDVNTSKNVYMALTLWYNFTLIYMHLYLLFCMKCPKDQK